MKPYLAIFSTVSLGKVSVSSTSCARGFTSFSANSLNSCLAISCSLDNVKSMMLILHCYLYLVVIIMMSGSKNPDFDAYGLFILYCASTGVLVRSALYT